MSFLRLCTCFRAEEAADYCTPSNDVSNHSEHRLKKTSSLLTGNGTSPTSFKTKSSLLNSTGLLDPLYINVKFEATASLYHILMTDDVSKSTLSKPGQGGTFSDVETVCNAIYQPSGVPVRLRLIRLDSCDSELSVIQHELSTLRQLRHVNIDVVLRCFVADGVLWCVQPSSPFGSCSAIMRSHFPTGLPQTAIGLILHDTLQALVYLHDRCIIHRCVRGDNLLVSANGCVKLTGLHHALSMLSCGRRLRAVHDFPSQHFLDNLLFASPELLQQNVAGYDTRSDVYSVGITACQLANGFVPFCDVPLTKMLIDKVQGVKPRLLDLTTVPELAANGSCDGTGGAPSPVNSSKQQHQTCGVVTSHDAGKHTLADSVSPASDYCRTFSPPFHEFVDLCLTCEPCDRPSAAAMLQHTFIRQVTSSKCSSASGGLLGVLHLVNTSPSASVQESVPVTPLTLITDQVAAIRLADVEWDL